MRTRSRDGRVVHCVTERGVRGLPFVHALSCGAAINNATGRYMGCTLRAHTCDEPADDLLSELACDGAGATVPGGRLAAHPIVGVRTVLFAAADGVLESSKAMASSDG